MSNMGAFGKIGTMTAILKDGCDGWTKSPIEVGDTRYP